jgi:hypothetical protein
VLRDHLADEDELVARLGEVEVICAMRERTPFGKSLLSRLPRLKVLGLYPSRSITDLSAAPHYLGCVPAFARRLRLTPL